ncbi:efflux RND transporter periplasmic adaptor subunit [Mediterraneibacter sp. NSJ-55]|uniref:Efflux RND transporter periplasmic adaptor subunit n=1 Tax=Mediterraneibacter hominis TaxID=2763054 RepID=A0A923LI45_9FIRM|nr:efflux RND transporter periplasmic adaptor subunit [Mediterraneibacter hominis]MBC5688733.1 efflux RND transporter periplasmic adaptor subunit [Mediterraneibacter hominis]
MFSKKKNTQEEYFDTTDILLEDDFPDEEAGTSSKPPKKKLPAWVIVPVLAVLLLGAFGLSKLTGGSKEASVSSTLKVTEVKKGNVKEVYNSTGTIESENTKTYYSPVSAPIKECSAEVGKTVKSGDLLVTFDTTDLERSNEQAQLNLQSSLNTSQAARAQNAQAIDAANAASAQAAETANALADTVNTLAAQVNTAYEQYQTNLALAGTQAQEIQAKREQLNAVIAENTKTVSYNQSIIDSIDSGYSGGRAQIAELESKENLSEEEEKLLNSLKSIFQDYDNAVSARNTAQTAIDDANSQLNSLADPNVDDAGYSALKAQYDEAYAQWQSAYTAAGGSSASVGMSAAELNNLDISDNLAELAALSPEELLEKGKEGMKADMDGVIASVDALQTNMAAQGAALFTIASTENVRVKIEVSPDDYEKMKTGSAVSIKVGEHTYQGTLTETNKIAVKNEKGTPVIGAKIHISNPDENICIGATAKITMTVAKSDNVLIVPNEVINASSDGDFVYVVENGVVKERPVELGTVSTTHTEIKSGLKEGDKVVNDLNVDIKEGMKAVAVEKEEE